MMLNGMQLPELSNFDALAEALERRDQRVRGRMSQQAYLDDIRARFAEALTETDTPIEELCTMLFEAPIRDVWDQAAFLNSQLRDAKKLGAALLKIVAEASFLAYQEAADAETF